MHCGKQKYIFIEWICIEMSVSLLHFVQFYTIQIPLLLRKHTKQAAATGQRVERTCFELKWKCYGIMGKNQFIRWDNSCGSRIFVSYMRLFFIEDTEALD